MRPSTRIEKLLILDHGALAARIEWTCHQLGIVPVRLALRGKGAPRALPTEREGNHQVGDRGEVIFVDTPQPDANEVVSLARSSGADTVHPGFARGDGDAALAEQVRSAGLRFVGPSADVLRLASSPERLRALATTLGVSIADDPIDAAVPRYQWLLLGDATNVRRVQGPVEVHFEDASGCVLAKSSAAPASTNGGSRSGFAARIADSVALEGVGAVSFGLTTTGELTLLRVETGLPLCLQLWEEILSRRIESPTSVLAPGRDPVAPRLQTTPALDLVAAQLVAAEGRALTFLDAIPITTREAQDADPAGEVPRAATSARLWWGRLVTRDASPTCRLLRMDPSCSGVVWAPGRAAPGDLLSLGSTLGSLLAEGDEDGSRALAGALARTVVHGAPCNRGEILTALGGGALTVLEDKGTLFAAGAATLTAVVRRAEARGSEVMPSFRIDRSLGNELWDEATYRLEDQRVITVYYLLIDRKNGRWSFSMRWRLPARDAVSEEEADKHRATTRWVSEACADSCARGWFVVDGHGLPTVVDREGDQMWVTLAGRTYTFRELSRFGEIG